MKGQHFSLILLPTLACNADCAYCFENKSKDSLTHEGLSLLMDKVTAFMERNEIEALTIHWQGGEVMTLPPEWYQRARDIVEQWAVARGRHIVNCIQSNMMAYNESWNGVLSEMFGNSVGSSLDYPNLYRRMAGSGPEEYNERWFRNVGKAREAGIHVGIISIPSPETFAIGAERFYSYYVDELGINDFQVNTPFPGGRLTAAKEGYPLDTERLGRFLIDLVDVWVERGYADGVQLGPFDRLIERFTNGDPGLPCIWRDNCANEFVCVDPKGNVSQCDCWVASYPEYRFGNVFECESLDRLLHESEARRRLRARPATLIEREDCLECDYLALCHGGCPIRAYTASGDLFTKDPYCGTYKILFRHVEKVARELAGRPDLEEMRDGSPIGESGVFEA